MKIRKLLPVLLLGSVLVVAGYHISFTNDKILINEVCGNNKQIELDDGSCSDYIELYNAGKRDSTLDSLYLSDDMEDLQKYSLTGYSVPAKGYVTISFADVTDFALNKNGESLFLSDKQGNILDTVTWPAMMADEAYARMNVSENLWKIATCTPGEENDRGTFLVEKPVYSAASGWYNEAFDLEMTAEEGTTIYYTVDGSIPDMESACYTEPVYVYDKSAEPNIYLNTKNVKANWLNDDDNVEPVDKCFIVRAVAVDENGNSSEVMTASYFIGKEQYKEKTVISLVADPDALFGENGIYVTGKEYDDWLLNGQVGDEPAVNYEKSGREYEIEASIEYFQEELVEQQEIGIRIQGNSTRGARRKRFSLFARDEYSGSSTFDIDFFYEKPTHSAVLRSYFSNAFLNTLVEDRAIGTLKARPVTVFLNGEFWYDTYLIEKYSQRYFEETYGVDKDNVVIIKDQEVEDGIEGDFGLYQEVFMYLADHEATIVEDYAEFCEKVDMQSFIDYYCTNIYLCNLDYNDNKNCMLWRVREPGNGEYNDGKWRWLLYDTDAIEWSKGETYGYSELTAVDTFSVKPQFCERPLNEQFFYSTVKKVPAFRKQFVLTFMDMVNTCFSVDNVSAKLEEWGENISWNNEFFLKRADYIVPYLAKEFELQGTLEEVLVHINNQNAGEIQLNTVTLDFIDETWTGEYFTDYPITVTAVEKPGYKFVGWTGSIESTEKVIEVDMKEGGIELNAVFEKDESR